MWWWVTESWVPAAFVLGSVAIVLGVVAYSTGRGIYAIAAVGCLAAIGLAYLVDGWVVTPSEEVIARTHSLAGAYVDDDRDAFFDHIGRNALPVRAAAVGAFEFVDVHDDLRITDVSVAVADDGESARIHFRANATVDVVGRGTVGRFPSRWNLDWEREEGAWRLVAVQRLHPVDGEPMQLLASGQ